MDFDALYQSGLDLWAGQYTGLYPLPAVGVFALLALMPHDTAYRLLVALSVAVYALALKRDVFVWLLYVPFWQVLFAGQIDILALGLLVNGSGPALALLTLKPQLLVFALPGLVAHKERIKPALTWMAALHLPTLIARPTWPLEWIGRLGNEGRWADPLTCSLYAVPMLALLTIIVAAYTKRGKFPLLSLCLNPTLRYYDYIMVAGQSRWAIPASWAAMALVIRLNAWWPMALIGVALWLVSALRQSPLRQVDTFGKLPERRRNWLVMMTAAHPSR